MRFSGGCALSRLTDESCSGTSFPSGKSSSAGSMATGSGFASSGFAGFNLLRMVFSEFEFFFFCLDWLCCIFGLI